MELGLGSAWSDAEQGRDIGVPVSFHVVQHEDRARPLGQPGDGLLEVEARAWPVLNGGVLERFEIAEGLFAPPDVGAPVGQREG